ncbi:hypothetical protein Tco_1315581 [Tanacetum coccineum]
MIINHQFTITLLSHPSSIPQLEYAPPVNQQPEFSQPDSGLNIPVFQKGDDPIDVINHMMSFLTAVVTSRYPTTNNQLRNSSNPMKQATINNGRVTLQPIQGRQTSLAAGTSRTYTPGTSWKVQMLVEAAVQNSNSSAQQDALILSMIEQLKTQVVNCTKINLDNKSVNDALTAELERYKEQVKVLKEGQNVDLRSNDTFQIHVYSLLGFQNPFYLKKAQQLEPKLYDGNVIKNTSAIVIPDSEETLMLAEENPTPSCRPTKVEVPKELPKVSMVNTSLKKLKHHLAGFDVVVKERTMATNITKGS